jgi:hypothetical protein
LNAKSKKEVENKELTEKKIDNFVENQNNGLEKLKAHLLQKK